jgi:hypothetical protein
MDGGGMAAEEIRRARDESCASGGCIVEAVREEDFRCAA